MKLSDYVVEFIKKNVADSVFLLSGGGIMHLVDSVGKSDINSICCHHEQGAVIAAEGYGRIKNIPGVAVVTTGPGGTNALTGIAGAWLDSIPMMVIAGQVKRSDITPYENGTPIVRQIGMQELNVVDMARPISKYAVTVMDVNDIRYHLEKGLYLAIHGRPGPVFIEIPLDVTTAEIDPENLKSFDSSELEEKIEISQEIMDEIISLMKKARKPLLMAGNGIRLAGGEEILWKLLEKTKINTVTSMFTADDLVTYDYEYYLGRQGMPGNKTANYAMDNCDLLIVIGERLQFTQTSWEAEKFADSAKIIMVDIDGNELKKKNIKIDIPVCTDAKIFLEELLKQDVQLNRWEVKKEEIDSGKYPVDSKYLNVYKFLEKLSAWPEKMDVATANGMASLTTHQALKISRGQRFITNAGLGHMGSGLPMAIGACVANGKRPVICMEGDGSIMLNIQELQTVLHHKLPIKIFIFNNNGYFSIRNTHRNFFGKLFASDPSCGVSLPDFSKLVPAWGLKYERIGNDDELDKLEKVMSSKDPIVIELMLDPCQPLTEKWSAGMYKEKLGN